MTVTEHTTIVNFLTGRGWTTLTDLRAGLKWPQSLHLATDLSVCVRKLEDIGVVVVTPRWEGRFSVCKKDEVLL